MGKTNDGVNYAYSACKVCLHLFKILSNIISSKKHSFSNIVFVAQTLKTIIPDKLKMKSNTIKQLKTIFP